jgi:hypothetical protein
VQHFRYLGWPIALGLILQGCATSEGFRQGNFNKYATPQELILDKNLNQSATQGRAYVYHWGLPKQNRTTEVLLPRKYLGSYCQAQGGRLTLAYKSQMSQIKNANTVKHLSRQRDLMQGIGAYRCVFEKKSSWIVSIEPTSDLQPTSQGKRSVVLFTKVMSEQEAKNFYKPRVKKAEVTKKSVQKVEPKEDVKLKLEEKKVQVVAPKPAARIIETPQQQQTQLYVAARRDINANKNVLNACNSAQRAYNFGKLQGTEGTRIYTESGMLVARCLTQISSYATRFPNAQAQAKRILQNLANNYNHSGAKSMLKQLK